MQQSHANIVASTKDGFVTMPLSFVKTEERQPLKTFTEPLRLTNSAASQIASTYILMVKSGATPETADFHLAAERAKQRGWQVLYEPGDHGDLLLINPTYFTQLLDHIVSTEK